MNRINKQLCIPMVATLVLLGAGPAHADAVTDWNAIMQTTVASSNAVVQNRSAAIVQLAVFEAVNAIVGDYEPYLGTIVAPPWASPDAAAIAAAHRTLVTLYPAQRRGAGPLAGRVALGDPGRPGQGGRHRGRARPPRTAMLRSGPATDRARPRPCPTRRGPIPGNGGRRRPRPAPALLPGWGQVIPFGLEEGSQFRSPPPPAIDTGKYAKDYNEVEAPRQGRQPLPPAGPHQCRAILRGLLAGAGMERGRAPGQRRARQDALGEREDLRPARDGPLRRPRSRRSTPSTTTTSGGR